MQNEIRAITKLCGRGTHSNIIEILRLEPLPQASYYFIDMKLCELNLEQYIHDDSRLNPLRFLKNDPSEIKTMQIWNIMTQITTDVDFLHNHKEIHRDLKPCNNILLISSLLIHLIILYSHKNSAWKLADFGISSEDTTRHGNITREAKGTPSYHTPELLNDRIYINKIDI